MQTCVTFHVLIPQCFWARVAWGPEQLSLLTGSLTASGNWVEGGSFFAVKI